VFGEHEVTMVDGSLAAATLGKSVTVKSYHHQGVADPGTLSVVGKADDGTTEAVQDTRRRFALGVLWHPEAGDDPRLFDALVAAASETETVPRWAMTETDKHPKRSLIELALLDKGPVHILRSKGDTLAAVGTALLVVGVLGMFIVLTTHESTRATVQNLIWWVSLVAAVAGGASRVGGAVLRTLALAREAETSRAE
jgi:hypothetical protein